MKENRNAWLDALMGAEGGWSDREPHADPGGKTMRGITLAAYAEWLGREATAEDLHALTEDDARAIALAMYWARVNGDALPAGIDIYAADFAFNSGPSRAARELQKLVAVEDDGFVGDATMTAIRTRDPDKLLRHYHDARMEFLEGLPNWTENARGWRNRCRKMLALAETKLQRRPMLAEAVKSKIVQAGTAGTLVSGGAIASLWPDYIGPAVSALRHAPPEALDQLQSGVAAIGAHATQAHAVGAMFLALVASGAGNLYAVWKRLHLWRKGLV